MSTEIELATRPRPVLRRLARPRLPDIGLRLRAQTVPLLVIAAVWGAGGLGAVVPGTLGWTVVVWTGTVLVAGGRSARRRTIAGSPARRRAHRHLLLVVAGGAGWLTLAAHAGPGGWRAVLLVAGGYTAAAPTWRRAHIPIPPDPTTLPEPEPEEVEVEAPDWVDLIPPAWAENLAAKDRVLAGSWLTERATVATGTTWTVRLTPGRHTTATAITAAPMVASALGLSLDRVTVDRHPSEEADKAQLLIVDRAGNPLRRLHPYPGVDNVFDTTTGMARIGVYADLDRALWQVYDPARGARGGVVIGSSGSGKSRLLELLGTSCKYSRRVLVWVADPQDGASLPALAPHTDWAAFNPDEIELMFDNAVKLITFRSKINAMLRREPHPISPEAPMVLIMLDECHQVLTPGSPMVKLADQIARMGRKAGVGLITATQYPEASSFGDKLSLRDSLAAANTVVLRTANKTTGGMLPGLEMLDPNGLPDIGGVGYTAGTGRRTAPFRTHFEEQPVVDALAAAAPVTRLEPAALAYLGDAYRDRHDRRLAAQADLAAEIADYDPELVAALAAADPALAAALDRHRARPTITVPPPRTTSPTPASTPTLGLLDIPAAPDFGPAPIVSAAAAAAAHPVLRTPSFHAIYQLVSSGVTRKGDLISRSGLSETQTRTALNALADAGLVTRAAHGTWTLTTPTTERTPR